MTEITGFLAERVLRIPYYFFVRKSFVTATCVTILLFAGLFVPGLRITVLVAGLLAAIFLPFTAIWNRSAADGTAYARNLGYALVMALILLSPSVTVLLIDSAA